MKMLRQKFKRFVTQWASVGYALPVITDLQPSKWTPLTDPASALRRVGFRSTASVSDPYSKLKVSRCPLHQMAVIYSVANAE